MQFAVTIMRCGVFMHELRTAKHQPLALQSQNECNVASSPVGATLAMLFRVKIMRTEVVF